MQWHEALEKISKYGHITCGMTVFFTGALVHVYHGLNADFVTFTTTVLGFLAHNAWVNVPDTPVSVVPKE